MRYLAILCFMFFLTSIGYSSYIFYDNFSSNDFSLWSNGDTMSNWRFENGTLILRSNEYPLGSGSDSEKISKYNPGTITKQVFPKEGILKLNVTFEGPDNIENKKEGCLVVGFRSSCLEDDRNYWSGLYMPTTSTNRRYAAALWVNENGNIAFCSLASCTYMLPFNSSTRHEFLIDINTKTKNANFYVKSGGNAKNSYNVSVNLSCSAIVNAEVFVFKPYTNEKPRLNVNWSEFKIHSFLLSQEDISKSEVIGAVNTTTQVHSNQQNNSQTQKEQVSSPVSVVAGVISILIFLGVIGIFLFGFIWLIKDADRQSKEAKKQKEKRVLEFEQKTSGFLQKFVDNLPFDSVSESEFQDLKEILLKKYSFEIDDKILLEKINVLIKQKIHSKMAEKLKQTKNEKEVLEAYIAIYGENALSQDLIDSLTAYINKRFNTSDDKNKIEARLNSILEEKRIENLERRYLDSKSEISEADFDSMTGHEFEDYLENHFSKKGYTVKRPPKSRDHGVDLILEKFGHRIAVQAKNYSDPVGNRTVRDIYAGKDFYKCDEAWIITTSDFSRDARIAAKRHKVKLIRMDELGGE